MTKKIPISLNKEDEAEALKLASLIDLRDCYGWYPKVCRFSITFTLLALQKVAKDIPDLDHAEMDLFFQSIKILKEAARNKELAEIHQKEAEKYNQKLQESIAQDILRPDSAQEKFNNLTK